MRAAVRSALRLQRVGRTETLAARARACSPPSPSRVACSTCAITRGRRGHHAMRIIHARVEAPSRVITVAGSPSPARCSLRSASPSSRRRRAAGWGGTVALATSLLLALLHLVMPHLLAPVKRTSAALALHVVVHPLRTRRAAVALRRGGGPDRRAHGAAALFAALRAAAAVAGAGGARGEAAVAAVLCEHHYLGDAAAAVARAAARRARCSRGAPTALRRAASPSRRPLPRSPPASTFAGEPALDASGVTRELFGLIAEQGVDDLLKPLDDGSLWLAPSDAEQGSAFADGFGAGDVDGAGVGRAPSPSARRLAFGSLPFRRAGVRGDRRARLPAALRALLAPSTRRSPPPTRAPADPVLFRFRVDALLEPGGIADVAMVMCEESLTFADDDAATPLCDGGAAREVTVDNVHEYAAASPSTHSSRQPPPPTSFAASGRRCLSALRHAGVGRRARSAAPRRTELPLDVARTRGRGPADGRGRGGGSRRRLLRRPRGDGRGDAPQGAPLCAGCLGGSPGSRRRSRSSSWERRAAAGQAAHTCSTRCSWGPSTAVPRRSRGCSRRAWSLGWGLSDI